MDTIRVVTGTGQGPTATAAYDAALLAAGVGNYNLVTVSSVLPAGATVTTPETAPSLGATGDRLTAVQARAVGDRAGAALAWGRTPDGEGLFYEGTATAAATSEDLRERALREAERGLTAGFDHRGWTVADRDAVAVAAVPPDDPPADPDPDPDADEDATRHGAAVALAVYGTGTTPF